MTFSYAFVTMTYDLLLPASALVTMTYDLLSPSVLLSPSDLI